MLSQAAELAFFAGNGKETIWKGICMIDIFTALYCEAHLFIQQYKLAKNLENTWFQEFYNETAGIRLTVTGVGEIAAAAAVGSTCSIYGPTRGDLLLNVGICAHTAENDGIFLCNKIVEGATGKTFYPDMLYRHPFREETIVTGMLPWNGENDITGLAAVVPAAGLYDMEAAAIYQAGARFLGPHQMIFLKIVSDRGCAKEVSKEQAAHLIEQYQDCIFDYIGQLLVITQKNESYKNGLRQEEEKLIETFCTDLHCSKAMRDSVKQVIRYLTLAGKDYRCAIRDMYEKKLLPCKDKREGKVCFEEFKRRLF